MPYDVLWNELCVLSPRMPLAVYCIQYIYLFFLMFTLKNLPLGPYYFLCTMSLSMTCDLALTFMLNKAISNFIAIFGYNLVFHKHISCLHDSFDLIYLVWVTDMVVLNHYGLLTSCLRALVVSGLPQAVTGKCGGYPGRCFPALKTNPNTETLALSVISTHPCIHRSVNKERLQMLLIEIGHYSSVQTFAVFVNAHNKYHSIIKLCMCDRLHLVVVCNLCIDQLWLMIARNWFP